MKNLVGCKVYSLVEVDRDFDQGEDITTLESFSTMAKVKSALKSNYNDVKNGLIEDGKEITYDDFDPDGTADLTTDSNSYSWVICEQVIK